MKNVMIIGAGAAGMMAAITAASRGNKVTIFEKNAKAGRKIYITGKGRCNLTNDCDYDELFQHIVTNEKFMYSAMYTFGPQFVMEWFTSHGLALKTERGNRVFPESDKAYDVIDTLVDALKQEKVRTEYSTCVDEIICREDEIYGVRINHNQQILLADAVVIATGGLSYPSTGSTGDGYQFAKSAGHHITELSPSLVPLEIASDEPKRMQGLSLKNVNVSFTAGKRTIDEGLGEMLFTHFGVSGPLVLSASAKIKKYMDNDAVVMHIDLKPALDKEQLDKRILKDFDLVKNADLKNSLDKLLPKSMIPVMIERSGISPEKKVNEITREERHKLVDVIKDLSYDISGMRDYPEAIITKGGVDVREVNPSTMESKLVKGLYFAGEVLDVDALTGGFNLQVAWSTGYLAGMSIE